MIYRPEPTLPDPRVRATRKPPPDTSWIEYDEICDAPNPFVWAMFLLNIVMGAAAIFMVLHA